MELCRKWNGWLSQWHSLAPTVLRLALGLGMAMHGWQKIGNFANVSGMLENLGFPLASFFAVLLIVIEFGGGLFVLAGLWTRVWSSLIAVTMVVAILMVHLKGGAELALLYLAIALALSFMGPGRFSLGTRLNLQE